MKKSAKEYLRNIRTMSIRIEQIELEISNLKDIATSTGKALGSDIKVQTTPSKDGRMQTVIKAVDLERELEQMKAEYIEYRANAIALIHSISDSRYEQILYKRYAEYKSFERIAQEMHYDIRHILRLHGEALNEFEKLMS